jgi:phosphomannomutase/phosphoglucomutase
MAVALGAYLNRHCRAASAEAPVALVAGDGRPLTAELVAAVAEGLRWTGCHVVDLGAASAPCVAVAVDHLQAAGGLLVGNPLDQPHTAGLKFWAPGPRPLSAGGGLDELQDIDRQGVDRPTRAFGSTRRFQADGPYLADLAQSYHALRPLRLVLDTSCPPVMGYLRRLTEAVACEIIPGHVPHQTLASKGPTAAPEGKPWEQITAQAAHFGARVGDDGEICQLWDERGHAVSAERLFVLLARQQLHDQPAATIVLECDTPPRVARTISAAGGRTITAAPGRAAMAEAIRGSGAVLGGGPSGRFWFAVGPAAADALRVLTQTLVLLSRSDRRLSEVLDAEAALE